MEVKGSCFTRLKVNVQLPVGSTPAPRSQEVNEMIDEKDLVYAIELRQSLAKKNGQMFVDMTYEIVSNILALLKEQEAVEPKGAKQDDMRDKNG